MCGIYGFTKYKQELLNINMLKKMGHSQFHRGPDSESTLVADNYAFGMRRLSIIDVEHGEQPFYSADKKVIIFCNGEIYNYKELRKELISDGIEFLTNSDIEVLPHLYKKYGIDFLDKLNGMFGMSIYDCLTENLYIARDRVGIKPLYFYNKNDLFLFSSELKSILLHDVDRELNFDALSSYIDLMFAPSPYTPFKHIKKVKSGHYIKIHKSNILENTSYEKNLKLDNLEYLDTIEKLLKDSSKLQIQADVNIGTFLSGGVDSSAVSVFASKEIMNKACYAFHMNWDGAKEKIDESIYAKEVAEQYDMIYCEDTIKEKEIFSKLRKLIWHLEEPMSDAAFIPTFTISEMASKNIKVILSGAGGDEVFGGYYRYKKKSFLKNIAKFILHGKKLSNSYYDIFKDENEKEWRSLFPWYKSNNNIRKTIDKEFKKEVKKGYVQAIMNLDLKYYLQDDILLLTDKMTMASSIEARVPLLDYRLINYCKEVPISKKIVKDEKKFILKKIMEKYVNDNILYRKKEGFGAPIKTWINENKYLFNDYFKDSLLIKNGLMNKNIFEKYLQNDNLSNKDSWIFWKILVLELWMEEFYD